MGFKQEDEFHERFLGFRIVKPPTWQFMPPAWSPFAQLRNAAETEIEWLKHANAPFVCFMKSHDSEHHVYPTTQVTSRPSAIPSPAVARQILDAQVAFLETNFDAFRLRAATVDRIIGGYRANSIVASYRLLAERDGEERVFDVLVRSLAIFTAHAAFTVGMSSSTDERYFDEADFDRSLGTIRIG